MTIFALLIIFAAVMGSVGMVSVFAYLLSRIRRLETGGSGDDGSRHLGGQVDRLREELLIVQEEMSSLTERVDFTDKLLMSGDDPDASGSAD